MSWVPQWSVPELFSATARNVLSAERVRLLFASGVFTAPTVSRKLCSRYRPLAEPPAFLGAVCGEDAPFIRSSRPTADGSRIEFELGTHVLIRTTASTC